MNQKVFEKNIRTSAIMNRETSFIEICEELDKRKKSFIENGSKGFTTEEVRNNFLNRKNTFLTSK